jgi:branched-chain amino acid transport system substrate-binding protein
MRRAFLYLTAAAALTAIAALPVKAAEEVKIGFTAALSGDFAAYGENMQRGLELAIGEINAKTDNGGVTLAITTADDRGLPSDGVLIAQRFCSDDTVDIVMGYSFSSVALAAATIINDCQLPVLASAVTSPDLAGVSPYFRRNVLTDAVQGEFAGTYAAKVLGAKRIAALNQQDDYGIGGTDAFVAAAKATGAEILSREAYVLGTKDFKTQLTSIKAQKPDLLWVGGFYTEAAKIAQQARQIGLDVQILGSDGLLSPKLIELGGASVDGTILYGMFDPSVAKPDVQAFVKAYKDKYGEEPNAWAALAYDAGYTLNEAAKLAAARNGKVDRAGLNAAFAEIKAVPGVTGPTTFQENGNREGTVVYLQVKDGKFILAPKQLN